MDSLFRQFLHEVNRASLIDEVSWKGFFLNIDMLHQIFTRTSDLTATS